MRNAKVPSLDSVEPAFCKAGLVPKHCLRTDNNSSSQDDELNGLTLASVVWIWKRTVRSALRSRVGWNFSNATS
jgi:hypothetical protein